MTKTQLKTQYQAGKQIHGFVITRSEWIDELQLRLVEAMHEKCGAKVAYLQASDPENVFCLSFQTIPSTSNGVAHILEHAVLCGSERYPVKDPFFCMTRRSLQTYMNACTGSDFTCYPAATCLPKDFYHLLDVYIDAVFFPKLEELSFRQEGHRLEFEDPSDPTTPLQYKGIVYNEMKGAMSSPYSRLREILYKELFPDTTYGVNSGGDPSVIPSLTYKEFKEFHATYYHPSRCLFYFYGDIPLEMHLAYLQERVLKDVEKLPPLEKAPLQKRFCSPKRTQSSYPSKESGENFLAFGFLTAEVNEQKELLILELLDQILFDTDANPLKRTLLESGLVPQVSTSFESDILQAPFVITCAGIKEEQADAIEKVLFSSLQKIVEEGIPKKLIENALHQLEIEKSAIESGHSPFGLELFWRAALPSQHGVDLARGLRFKSDILSIRQELEKNPRYFEEKLLSYFLQNPHWVRLLLTPDASLIDKEEEKTRQILKKIEQNLSLEEKKKLVEEAQTLLEHQRKQEEESDEVLPTVTLGDVPEAPRDYPLIKVDTEGATLYTHTCVTNGLCYMSVSLPLPHLLDEELWLLRLLSTFWPQVGTKNKSYTETLELMQQYTGGIAGTLCTYTQVDNPHLFTPHIQLKSRCLSRNVEQAFSLLREILYEANFLDKERLKELLKKQHVQLKSSLVGKSLKYALSLSQSALSPSDHMHEKCFGLSYLKKLEEIIAHLPEKLADLQSSLSTLHEKIVKGKTDLIVSCEESLLPLVQKEAARFSSPKDSFIPFTYIPQLPAPYFHSYENAAAVSFAAKAMITVPYTEKQSAAYAVTSHLLQNLYLHRAIREEGGAYGGGAQTFSLTGKFSFFSYRDPQIYATLHHFENSLRFLLKNDFSERDLTEAKLEVYQQLDAPLSPEDRADTAYFWKNSGLSYPLRCKWREHLKNVTKEQVQTCCKELLAKTDASTCVFAGTSLLEKENRAWEKQGGNILQAVHFS